MKRLAALLALVPACEGPPAAKADDHVECAVDGAESFERVCILERSAERLTLRGPDGGFRRLTATRDGRGVIAADGAEPATVTIVGKEMIEVSIGSDRYRLPARVR